VRGLAADLDRHAPDPIERDGEDPEVFDAGDDGLEVGEDLVQSRSLCARQVREERGQTLTIRVEGGGLTSGDGGPSEDAGLVPHIEAPSHDLGLEPVVQNRMKAVAGIIGITANNLA
jgi:hypothetical protein